MSLSRVMDDCLAKSTNCINEWSINAACTEILRNSRLHGSEINLYHELRGDGGSVKLLDVGLEFWRE